MEVRVRRTGDQAGLVSAVHPLEKPTVTRDSPIFTVEVVGASESANLTSSANFKSQGLGRFNLSQFFTIISKPTNRIG